MTTSVGAALARARRNIPAAEARMLLAHVLDRPHAWLVAHDDAPMTGEQSRHLARLVGRRSRGEPIAYLVGSREFYGRRFLVDAEVLIPRPETELLVDLAIAKLQHGPAARILDLGAGSGCIAITLALELPAAVVTAAERSPAALQLARRNADRQGARLRFIETDWYARFAGERFDLIVANPPYVAAADPHLDALRFEPPAALASGADGLTAIRQIVAGAPSHLSPGGQLLLEHGYDQSTAVAALLRAAGLVDIEQHRDLAGIVRVSGGRLKNGP